MKAVMFDLDGTLLDTIEDIGNACNMALAEFGYPTHPLSDYRKMVGNGFYMLVLRALPKKVSCGITQETMAPILAASKKAYGEHLCERTRPYPGLPETLDALTAKGITLCVLSNKPDDLTKALITHYFPKTSFARVWGAREDRPLKPDPTAALTLLEELVVSPEECLYVGDSPVDMQTAHDAGMPSVSFSWGFSGRDALLAAGAAPDSVLDRADQLLEKI
ncbi:MAG: HAD family hydrolase [Desulfovibrio sp.]|nr:HAD family hydrolase [Desulfovibrio sp.]